MSRYLSLIASILKYGLNKDIGVARKFLPPGSKLVLISQAEPALAMHSQWGIARLKALRQNRA